MHSIDAFYHGTKKTISFGFQTFVFYNTVLHIFRVLHVIGNTTPKRIYTSMSILSV